MHALYTVMHHYYKELTYAVLTLTLELLAQEVRQSCKVDYRCSGGEVEVEVFDTGSAVYTKHVQLNATVVVVCVAVAVVVRL
jgi:membrane-bound inhibitor of C-type lysozyme